MRTSGINLWLVDLQSPLKPCESQQYLNHRKGRPIASDVTSDSTDVTSDSTDVKRTMREYYEQFYVHKFSNLGEMNRLLARHTNYQSLVKEEPII